MQLSAKLQQEIVDFLTSLPTVHDTSGQQALINSAGLDAGLMRQITFPGSVLQFFELLVPFLLSYGRLEDGRHPLHAILKAARGKVGTDRGKECDRLMQELRQILPEHDAIQTEQKFPTVGEQKTLSVVPLPPSPAQERSTGMLLPNPAVAQRSASSQFSEESLMSTISQRQNELHQIQRLKAQRYLYDEARRWKGYRKIVTIPVAFVLAALLALLTRNDVWVALSGVVLTIIDLFGLRHQEHALRREAASIQELFDCDVLQLTQNRALLGIPPASDDVADYAREYDPSRYPNSPLENWYSVKVDQLPLYLARLVCQRANLRWDQRLRHRHVNTIIRDAVLLAVAIAAGGVALWWQQLTVWGFAFAALVPALIFAADEIAQNRATIRALSQLKTDIYALWDQLFTGKATEAELERTARQWQDEIYRHRQSCPLLPNAFYDKYRNTDEAAMWESSGALVDEALRKLKDR